MISYVPVTIQLKTEQLLYLESEIDLLLTMHTLLSGQQRMLIAQITGVKLVDYRYSSMTNSGVTFFYYKVAVFRYLFFKLLHFNIHPAFFYALKLLKQIIN